MESVVKSISEFVKNVNLPALVPVNFIPWNAATVTGRLIEELGVDGFVFLTRWEVADTVEESLQHVQKEISFKYIGDYKLGRSLLRDDLFENSFLIKNILEGMFEPDRRHVVVDLTMTTGELASASHYALKNLQLADKSICVTVVETIPLQGIPAYPGNPRWLHKVYIYGSNRVDWKGVEVVTEPPKIIEWKGTRGVYIAVSKLMNSLAGRRILELFDGMKKEVPEREEELIEIYLVDSIENENKKLLSVETLRGPDEETASLLYNSWRAILEVASKKTRLEEEVKVLERILKQLQRLTGAADLVVEDIASQEIDLNSYKRVKLHAFIRHLREEYGNVAVLPDTNMFYQGFHMSLLKASIRNNSPWSPLPNVEIYIPVCAEAEINGKIATTSSTSQALPERYSYIMALLANRVLQEVKYHYKARALPAISQPCEASMAVESSNLQHKVILLITADRKAFNAWQTFNACRGNIVCGYVDHSNAPLNTSSHYSKFYASIVLANVVFTTSLFTRVMVKSKKNTVVLDGNRLKGATAPSITISKINERTTV
uniref:Uncharacterized protein n=1 Tax=Thermogladius calderae TaxID=1200300 RepID=A0A7J3XXM5_9CREN